MTPQEQAALPKFPQICDLYERGLIKTGTVLADQIMLMAKAYSRKTGLVFDGTLKGAFKLAEEAYRTNLEAIEAARKKKGKAGVYDDVERDERQFVQ